MEKKLNGCIVKYISVWLRVYLVGNSREIFNNIKKIVQKRVLNYRFAVYEGLPREKYRQKKITGVNFTGSSLSISTPIVAIMIIMWLPILKISGFFWLS